MIDVEAIQAAIREFGFDGWLLCDFRGSNVLAQRVLGLAPGRRGLAPLFLFDPRAGRAAKARPPHRNGRLDHVPGSKTVYLRWQELEAGMRQLVAGMKTVAMEYSPPQRDPLHLARRCGDGRIGAELRRRDRLVRRSDPALRGGLGRRAGAIALRGGCPHRLGLRPRLAVDRRRASAKRARSKRSKCRPRS